MDTAVVFDIGNVLLEFNPMAYIRSRYPQEEVARQLHHIIFQSEEWLMLDAGVCTILEAADILCERHPGRRDAIRDILANWTVSLRPIPSVIALARTLAEQGYRIYYLSNISEPTAQYVELAFDFLKMFHGGVFSCREKLIKPSPEIFHLFLDRYGLRAENCVFIDDTPGHVQSALTLGFRGFVLENPSHLQEAMESLLGRKF